MKRNFLLSLVAGLFLIHCITNVTEAQSISGIVNTYATVTSIKANDIKVDNSTGFLVNDKVMIIQMKGAIIDTTNSPSFGNVLNYNNAGNYEFALVVGVSGNTVTVQYPLCRSYSIPGHVQLIRVPVYNSNVTVTDTVTCQPWNGLTGGVVVLEVNGALTLNSAIDVSGKGFNGGAGIEGGYGIDTRWYASTAGGPYNGGGQKGEGIADYILNKDAARGKQANGGGGSSLIQDGGGGGGNYSTGGFGGYGFSGWVIGYHDSTVRGIGGLALPYLNGKIFLGGGGGGGCADNGQVFTPGTNGAGIIIITANSIIGNNNFIKADGIDVTQVTNDEGAGGGGAGGAVLLNVKSYSSLLNVETRGGKGGDNYNILFAGTCHGTGGGGGGGLLWLSIPLLPSNVGYDGSGGKSGYGVNPTCVCYGTPWGATNGDTTYNPLFNYVIPPLPLPPLSVADNLVVCTGSSTSLNPSGKPAYSYTWTPSTGLNCNTCASPLASPTVATIYTVLGVDGYCRDSAEVSVTVDSAFHAGQITANRDTICPGTPVTLTLSGNNSSIIQWKSSTSPFINSDYSKDNGATNKTYKDFLTASSFFRAIVGQGQCSDSVTYPNRIVVAVNPSINYTQVIASKTVTYSPDSASVGITHYSWDFGDSTATSSLTSPVHTYKKFGTYYVCLTVYNGSNCSYTYCKYVQVDSLVSGVNNIVGDNIWKVYPDPAHTQLFIGYEHANITPESIEVYDVLGRRVLVNNQDLKNSNPIHIDISNFSDGMYYLMIKTSGANYIHPFVKQQ